MKNKFHESICAEGMPKKMKNEAKTVLVTGSARGIGFAIAEAFVRRGNKVVLNCREDIAQLEKATDELRRISLSEEYVTGICADVSDYNACALMFSRVAEDFGQVEILVNNAGSAYFGLFAQMNLCEMQTVISANLMGTINCSHLAVPGMISKKSGNIINITSIQGITGASCEAVYSAAKAGVNGLTKSLAKELAPSGVRVNAIACGAFDTRMNARLSANEKNAFAESVPMGRFGKPPEAAELAVFLASDAASYLTGQIIPLDGGIV
ncbi:MAG: 3-oxoacyl-ACP reductase FabG [Defluviitaleaceae bacterium]|nr:3-oxoacyl-ACP reductase FabG [Defluviitaleaceae bacterium]